MTEAATRTRCLVGRTSEFSSENRKIVTVRGQKIVVLLHEGEYYALSAICPHQGGPVGEGLVLGRVEGAVDDQGRYLGDRFSTEITDLVCPWHGWAYDIRTGRSAGLPSVGLTTYETEVSGEDVYVYV